jgi:pilus assembly protein CpaC
MPEVSTIDYSTGVKFDGFLIPGLSTRRAKTGVELRDGQSFALAGLMDNREIKSMSEVPFLSQIPVIGNLFKSKSFQKNESELMFIVTASIVKPVNRDDIPQLRGIDGLKNGSPLGVEPRGEGIQGQTGFKVSGQNNEAPKPAEPVKTEEAKPKTATEGTSTTEGSATGSSTSQNGRVETQPAPVAKVEKPEPKP